MAHDTKNDIHCIKACKLDLNADHQEFHELWEMAEQTRLRSLQLRESSPIPEPACLAISQTRLGRLYTIMGKYDEAYGLLTVAEITYSEGSDNHDCFEVASTREKLGRLFEVQGMLDEAKKWRLKGAPKHMVCSHHHCPSSKVSERSEREDLQACAKCKSVFYCGRRCQKNDWPEHKMNCKKQEPKLSQKE